VNAIDLDEARRLVRAHRAAKPYSHATFIARSPDLVEGLIAEVERLRRHLDVVEHNLDVARSRQEDAESNVRLLISARDTRISADDVSDVADDGSS